MSKLQNMRKSYDAGQLDEQDIATDPMVQFQHWFEAARSAEVPDWLEPNAMTVSTSADGVPTSRIVLLKQTRSDADGPVWTFYSNYGSAKGSQIDANANVSLCFYWPHRQQQIRIVGTATKSDRRQTEAYFHSRPRESQLGAVASDQSDVLRSREQLQKRWDDLRESLQEQPVPCPDHWGGYDVLGREIEFWQGRPGRLHDRLRYRRQSDRWIVERLAP